MINRHLAIILTVFFVLSVSTFAQSPAKVIAKAEKAAGGKKALAAVGSVVQTGSIIRRSDGRSGRISVQSFPPTRFRIAFDIDGRETELVFNGRSAWHRENSGPPETTVGESGSVRPTIAAFRNGLWLNAKTEKAKFTTAGDIETGGRKAISLRMTNAKGSAVTLYFDKSSGSFIGEQYSDGTSLMAVGNETSGRLLPARTELRLNGETYDITFSDTQKNAVISADVFNFPNISDRPLPELRSFLASIEENTGRVEELLDTYSFVEKVVSRELGSKGELIEKNSETFQLSFYKGKRIRRSIEKDGKPLDAKEQERSDRDAQRQVDDIDKQAAKIDAAEKNSRVSIAELLRASSLINPRREKFRGRDVIVFDFEPDPAFDYRNAKSMLRFFGKTGGVIWVDEKDRQVARIEARLLDSYNVGGGVVAKLRKGASFTLDQERVNDEIWLPSSADINLSVRVLLVKGVDINQLIRYYDYRKFATEVQDAAVDPPKEQ